MLQPQLLEMDQTSICNVLATRQDEMVKWQLLEMGQTIIRDILASMQV
jgi:hypothetical protein